MSNTSQIGKTLFWFVAIVTLIFATTAGSATKTLQESPMEVSGVTTVDAEAAKKLFDEEVLFVDLRQDAVYEAGRIPGSVHMDFKKDFSSEGLAAEAKKDEPLVFYCSGVRCPRSSKASAKAIAWGYTKVYYFRGGFPEWKAAGYPVE